MPDARRIRHRQIESGRARGARAPARAARRFGRRSSGTRDENISLIDVFLNRSRRLRAHRPGCSACAVAGRRRRRVCRAQRSRAAPRPRAGAKAAARTSPLHAVHAAQRAARDPARGPHRAARHGERLVSRRIGAREARAHRLRAPLRAPDVRGLGARQGRRVRHSCSRRPAAPTTPRPTTDRTNYYIDVPSNALDLALFLESDRMGYLLDAMSPKTRRRPARRREERAARRATRTRRTAWRRSRSHKMLYPEGHPYRWPTIGYMEDLTAASYEDVVEFFKTYYEPANASLVDRGRHRPGEGARRRSRSGSPT